MLPWWPAWRWRASLVDDALLAVGMEMPIGCDTEECTNLCVTAPMMHALPPLLNLRSDTTCWFAVTAMSRWRAGHSRNDEQSTQPENSERLGFCAAKTVRPSSSLTAIFKRMRRGLSGLANWWTAQCGWVLRTPCAQPRTTRSACTPHAVSSA
jgi:hypothetical protein